MALETIVTKLLPLDKMKPYRNQPQILKWKLEPSWSTRILKQRLKVEAKILTFEFTR